MAARKNEMGLFMFGHGEGGGLVAFQVVAAIAGIEIWSSRELIRMPVAVTIGAVLELHLKQSVFALGDVTLRALEAGMAALQRISRCSVLLHREQRRLPSLYVVASGALATIGTFGELPVVRVFVAIHASLEQERLLEIPTGMALSAVDANVLAQQWKLRLGVIEVLIDSLERHFLPSTRAVARLAALRKTAAMRIFVAVRTLIEGNSDILWLAVGTVRVALRALHLRMQSGQRIARLGVIELRDADLLPVDEVVTGLALRSQASFVLIFVAGGAGSRDPEIGADQILFFDCCPLLRRDVRWIVTLGALDPCMLAFEDVSDLFVVEGLRVPFHEREVFTIVFRVTSRAFLARACGDVVSSVQSPVGRQASSDFGVAIEALQRGLSAELMASGAIGRSVEGLVGAREWPRGNLC